MRNIILCILFISFPMLLEWWFIRREKLQTHLLIKKCIFTALIVNAFVGCLRLSTIFSWSYYEYFLLNIEISIVITMLIFPLFQHEKYSSQKLLHMICLMSIAVALYSTLTHGRTVIHSDCAIATLLAQSQIKHHNPFPSSWCYANGDIWVITMNIFTMPFSILLSSQSLARAMGSMSLIATTILGIYFLHRKLLHDNSWMLSIPVFLIFLFGSFDMIIYEAAYTSPMLSIVVTSTLFYNYFSNNNSKKKMLYYIAFFTVVALLCIGGIRQLAESIVPLLGACLTMLYLQIRENEKFQSCRPQLKKVVIMMTTTMIPVIIGLAIYRHLCSTRMMNNTIDNALQFSGSSFYDCWNNFEATIIDMFLNFGYWSNIDLLSVYGIRNMISFFACILIVFVCPFLQFKKLKEESEGVRFFFLFGVFHNLIMFLLAVLFGKTLQRYLLTFIYVCIIISSRYIMTYWIIGQKIKHKTFLFFYGGAAIIQCIAILLFTAGWRDTLSAKQQFSQGLIDLNLTKGYATYWNAYSTEIYSDLQLRFGGIKITEDGSGITPFKWLVDAERFEVEDTNTFLLLSPEENEMLESNLPDLFGEPLETFSINNMYVYLYDHDIMADVAQEP